MDYNIIEIIEKKIRKEELKQEEIEFFVQNYTKGIIPDYQAASLITAIMINGMTIDETYFLTSSMINSGKRITFIKEVLDKHSTGGVGDKVTISLIPILASMGYSVLKMSRKRTSVILGRNS